MALFDNGYVKPGVYTEVFYQDQGVPTFGAARIPVLIGEGQEFFSQNNVELHRGSSATADDQIVGENLSDQVGVGTRNLQLSYFPIVTGNGTGTVTNDPQYINIVVNGVPAVVVSVNGNTGAVVLQDLLAEGDNVTASYYFKRHDTKITNEDLSAQIPKFASLTVQTGCTISVTTPGALGNTVSITLTQANTGSGVTDAQAVTGSGTNSISIEVRNSDDTIRTLSHLATLISAGIPTSTSGYLTMTVASANANTAAAAHASAFLSGGAGPSTNTIFKTAYTPVVDGTNGGVVTANPANVAVLVNGKPATVAALDGANGLVTLASGVTYGSTLTITYYTNNYQDTADIIPAANVASITAVGYGPNRANFTAGVDYLLSTLPNGFSAINWGACASTAVGTSTPGYTTFDATAVATTLVDEKVYLRPVTGAVNGTNAVFTLADSPTDGSGLARVTDNPALVSVYVGADPVQALESGSVKVSRLQGAKGIVTLYNPPPSGSNVYATYYRNTLNDHKYVLAVASAGIPGQGTYTITDELGNVVPVVNPHSAASVQNNSFATTGIVFPNNVSDLVAPAGAPDETITLTFEQNGVNVTTPSVAARLVTQGITFTASTPGTAGDGVTIAFTSVGTADSSAISVVGNAVTVDIQTAAHATRTTAQVAALFTAYPPTTTAGGVITATGGNTSNAAIASATNLAGGVDEVTVPVIDKFVVSSNATGGSAGVGYLGQTYIDAVTGVKFTVVDPAKAVSYGFTQLPSPQYSFAAGDTLSFSVNKASHQVTGSTLPVVPGLHTKVVTTFGMAVGDTVTVTTFKGESNSPAVGDYYYASFTLAKQTADYSIRLFTNPKAAYALYGQPSTVNRLSLGVQLLTGNGAQLFGCIQVPKQLDTNLGSDADFMSAIDELNLTLPGTNVKASVIVPLTTSDTVQQYLSRHLITQASVRNKGEAMGVVGLSRYSSPQDSVTLATDIHNSRIIVVAPFVAGVNIANSSTGVASENAVSGEFMAAALAGLMVNSSNDVATSLTGQQLVGFTRPLQRYDEPTMDLMAAAGITVLVDNAGSFEIRDYKSTDPDSILTSEPSVTTSMDFVAQQFRAGLKQFIGRKLVAAILNDIKAVSNNMLQSDLSNLLIQAYRNTSVTPDSADPTLVHVSFEVLPIFCTKYIEVQMTVTLS